MDPDSALEITLSNSGDPMFNILNVSLPGLEPNLVRIPAAMEESPFQSIGIRLKDSKLAVIVNCSILEVLSLEGASEMLLVEDELVSFFDSEAIVSHI